MADEQDDSRYLTIEQQEARPLGGFAVVQKAVRRLPVFDQLCVYRRCRTDAVVAVMKVQ